MKPERWNTKNSFNPEISLIKKLGICLFRYELSPKEKLTTINSSICRMLGYKSASELKPTFRSLFKNPEDFDVFIKTIKKEKTVKFHETEFKKKDKKDLWVAITASISKSKGNPSIEGLIEDISKHKELEKKLYFEKQLFRNLLDNLPDAVYFKDEKNRLIKVNRFYAQGFKMKPKDIIGKTDFDFFPKDQAQKMFEDDTHVLKTGNPIIGKIERTLLPNGTYNCVTTTKIPVYDRKHKIIGTMGITRDITAYDQIEQGRLNMVMSSLKVLDKVLEIRDPYTFGHTRRVSMIAEKIAEKLGWSEDKILELKMSAELHDIGKILVPLEILNKPGLLSDLEFKLIQEHVKKCYEMLKPHSFPFPLAEAIYQHHERLDGKGYPRGLSKEKIIPEARILAISDVLEAMTNHRPYRAALGISQAMEELKDNAGSKYDENIVATAMKLLEENNHRPFWIDHEPSI